MGWWSPIGLEGLLPTLTDYPKVDTPDLPYKPVNFWREKDARLSGLQGSFPREASHLESMKITTRML
jgi:hypothetical protein